jgi:homoaconitase/3-isopropylmalate dehydratase large subunit
MLGLVEGTNTDIVVDKVFIGQAKINSRIEDLREKLPK